MSDDVTMNINCRFSIFVIKLDIQINILLLTANDSNYTTLRLLTCIWINTVQYIKCCDIRTVLDIP